MVIFDDPRLGDFPISGKKIFDVTLRKDGKIWMKQEAVNGTLISALCA